MKRNFVRGSLCSIVAELEPAQRLGSNRGRRRRAKYASNAVANRLLRINVVLLWDGARTWDITTSSAMSDDRGGVGARSLNIGRRHSIQPAIASRAVLVERLLENR
jgi:hypothetical protein